MQEHLPKEITVTDQTIDISSFSEQWKENVFKLAEKILVEYKASNKSRFIVAIGGASGSSKSTTAVVLEYLLNSMKPELLTLNVGQDGYHYRQNYLEENLDSNGEQLAEHKGRYDSFEIDELTKEKCAFLFHSIGSYAVELDVLPKDCETTVIYPGEFRI